MAKKPKIQTRKPPSTAALEQFVAGGGATPKARDGKTTTYTRKTGESAGVRCRLTVAGFRRRTAASNELL